MLQAKPGWPRPRSCNDSVPNAVFCWHSWKWGDRVDACFADVRAAHRSPLAALVAAATEMTRQVESPRSWRTVWHFYSSMSAIRISTDLPSRTRGVWMPDTERCSTKPSLSVSSDPVTRPASRERSAVWVAR